MKPIFIFLILAVVSAGVWFFVLRNDEGPIDLNPEPLSSFGTTTTAPLATELPETKLPEKVMVTMKTSRGDIELELYPTVAPKTVLNFLSLAQNEFYDGTKFHRVVSGFVIQGGDPLSMTDDPKVGTGGPGYVFEDEINPKSLGLSDAQIKQLEEGGYKYNYDLQSLPNSVGALSMANAGPGTNGSQFFIITEEDQPSLNGKHTVFGKVVGSMEVVRAIQQGDVVQKINFDLQ